MIEAAGLERAGKDEKYQDLARQVEAVIAATGDLVANLANVAALIHQGFGFHWVGFYRATPSGSLVLGPFQGPPACIEIPLGKGVCGTAAATQATILVPDVDAFPGHIACSAASRSEIVVPLVAAGATQLVLDIDSAERDAFDETDRAGLEAIIALIARHHFPQAPRAAGEERPETVAAGALGFEDKETGAIIPAIHPSTTYLRDPDNAYRRGRVYSRADNPTYDGPGAVITALEGGAETLLFASGMAAATAVFQSLSPGDHVIVPKVMYWALRSWLHGFATRWGLDVEGVELSDTAALAAALRPGKTRLVWVESPANPLWTVTDIAAAAELAHAAGARLAVDSTVASPVLTRPLSLGADIVMHSASKYLNGHSDVIAGTLTTSAQDEFWARIVAVQRQVGGIIGPFEAWLLQRGLRTLFARVRWQSASALALAHRLAAHPHVAQVLYPGLPDFPGHDVAARQMQGGFGGMMSIRVKGGPEAAIATAARVRIWRRATSLGGVDSLIEHRATIEGPTSPVPGDLLRLSVGLEATEDLYDDLAAALTP